MELANDASLCFFAVSDVVVCAYHTGRPTMHWETQFPEQITMSDVA